MKEKILNILKKTVAIDSFSSTDREDRVTEYLYRYMNNIDYFKNNSHLFGNTNIENDYLNRHVSYGLVLGNSKKTVVLLNHYDVVGIDDYGNLKDFAFDIDNLKLKMKEANINSEALDDLNSDEWIFGRGVADMKGGLAIQLAYIEKYSQLSEKPGNVLFISVPDEESYSTGMRYAAKMLHELKTKYNLEYSLVIDCEPNHKTCEGHIVSIGTAGKCMPTVLVQGQKAHISRCFDGLNPLGVLMKIFNKTELSLEFSDELEGEVTVPPTWTYLKDMKNEYDVSVPIRASGYFNVISFYTSPDEILEKLKLIAISSFDEYIDKMKKIYDKYRFSYKNCSDRDIEYSASVMTFEELFNYCLLKDETKFTAFYSKCYENIKEKIVKNKINYPQATILIMERVLNFSEINYPIVILGFAPPYYPALNSKKIKNKGNDIMKYYSIIKNFSNRQGF